MARRPARCTEPVAQAARPLYGTVGNAAAAGSGPSRSRIRQGPAGAGARGERAACTRPQQALRRFRAGPCWPHPGHIPV